MIPSDITLVLRLLKGSPLTHLETDTNFQNLKEAILAIAGVLTDARVVFGAEPALSERVGILWIPADFRGIFVWDGTNWIRISNRKLYAVATNVANAYSLTLPAENKIPDLASIVGVAIFAKIPASNSGASTLALNTFAVTPITAFGAALKSGAMQSGETCALVYDGTNFNLLNAKGAFQDYVVPVVPSPVPTMVVNPASPWTVPTGVTKVRVRLIGGGGVGGSGASASTGGDGGCGAEIMADCTVEPGQEIAITIGAGGTSAGQSGGATIANYFSSSWVLTAGGGTAGSNSAAGGPDVYTSGAQGVGGAASSSGGGILAIAANAGRRGMGSHHGLVNGVSGQSPGEGGQGGSDSGGGYLFGAGAAGQVIIEY